MGFLELARHEGGRRSNGSNDQAPRSPIFRTFFFERLLSEFPLLEVALFEIRSAHCKRTQSQGALPTRISHARRLTYLAEVYAVP